MATKKTPGANWQLKNRHADYINAVEALGSAVRRAGYYWIPGRPRCAELGGRWDRWIKLTQGDVIQPQTVGCTEARRASGAAPWVLNSAPKVCSGGGRTARDTGATIR